MKPLDPRLLRYARSARGVLGFGGLLGVLRTLAVIIWCWCLAQGITALVLPVLGGPGGGRVAEGVLAPAGLPGLLGAALAALLLRAASSWAMDVLAAGGAVRVKRELRSAALDALDARSPEALAGTADAGPAIALGRGLDALDGYFTGYLPQLILAACATPLLMLAVLLADPVSGITVLIVFPVIPLFMVLIGLATRSVQQRQWGQLQRLSGAFLDVVEGLATLKIFRREGRQVERIARETGEYRSRTMQVLRVTFLSGFVLDLAGTFSIALVAVTVGTRLVVGEFPLALGLFVLLLLPEVFLPIRQVGAAFHASAEGLAAADEVFALIEGSTSGTAPGAHVEPASAGIAFDGVVVERGGRAVVGPVSFGVQAGEIVALTGASGSGKSTLVSALLGFVAPSAGGVTRPRELAWAGQRPGLLQGTVAANVALGDPEPDPEPDPDRGADPMTAIVQT
ncbi:MAG: ATP-binding cassette domain-containing protein, partial [Actinobacteria bacterium]|nr:ATP-binding cassette domain-containing protein [Actinomycetota bacterium]